MTSRERIINALEFKPVDKIGLESDVWAVALYEHGEKVRELFKAVEGDFAPVSDTDYEMPTEQDFDSQGNYYKEKTDDWGVTTAYRIFGIQGHPVHRPLDDWSNLKDYKLPPVYGGKGTMGINTQDFDNRKAYFDGLKAKGYFTKAGVSSLLERAYTVRKFEDVLADVASEDEDFIKLTDMMCERISKKVKICLDLDLDGVQFGDDFGMQSTMLISPESFRNIYKPRYEELIRPIKKAGKKVFFHTCGYVKPILEDLKEIGVDSIWPQLTAYNLKELTHICRELQLAVAIHPDRSNLMTKGTPEDVTRVMNEYIDAFRPQDGGSFFYFEVDNGFPYENIVAMINVAKEFRK